MSGPLDVRREGEIALITIDRPHRRNALDPALWDALLRAAMELTDHPPRAVILSGAGEHFCAGMDLALDNPLFARLEPLIASRDAYRVGEEITALKKVFDSISRIPAPVIAAIEGACAGGGLELALAADLRVASETAFFSLPETRWGMVPDVGGTVRLSKLVGRAWAAELILTGARIDVERAARWGLVNDVVPAGAALERAREMAENILKAGPKATLQALNALRVIDGEGDAHRMELETEAGARAIVSGEVHEGLAAFNQKREPRW